MSHHGTYIYGRVGGDRLKLIANLAWLRMRNQISFYIHNLLFMVTAEEQNVFGGNKWYKNTLVYTKCMMSHIEEVVIY